jgi:uncharacterized protein with HEPN domain
VSRSVVEVLSEAVQHLEALQGYAGRGLDDQLVIDAICMRLSAAIEVLARLEPDVRERLFGQDWPLMWGMRNRIAHGYLLVDSAIIRQTIAVDVPLILGRAKAEVRRDRA